MQFLRSSTTISTDSGVGLDEDMMDDGSDQLFFVTAYSDFEKLAHGPRGTEATQCIYVFRFFPSDGSMVLLNKFGNKEDVMNPAFSRFHPKLDVVYTCTESCLENGQVVAYKLDPEGNLEKIGQVDAGGTSTCYITLDQSQKNMLVVNYWNSTLAVIPLDTTNGNFTGPIHSIYDPNEGKPMKAPPKKKGGVNHSLNDDSTIKSRQADPHSHALVLDPYVGTVAYVPDLGKDLIREFFYNNKTGSIELELNFMPSGLCTGHPDGPRYFEFHPTFGIGYVVNELSSTIAVFAIDRQLLQEINQAAANGEPMDRFKGRSTLTLIQSVKTIPAAFSTKLNTCGRICVHKNGRFVIVSNRGHESLAIFRVKSKGPRRGQLDIVGYFHTRGETPRHFQFDSSGQFLIVANQDSDSVAVFSFNLSSGALQYTGNEYRVPSPNFICSCPIRDIDHSPQAVSFHEFAQLPTTVDQRSESHESSPDRLDSDLEESDGSTMAVNDAEVLQKQLADALRQVDALKAQLSSLSTTSS